MARGRGRARRPKLEAHLEQDQTQVEGTYLVDNEDLNPFASAHSSGNFSSDSSSHHTGRKNYSRQQRLKRVFDFKDYPEDRKVKLVALKLKKYAQLWWENLKKQRDHEEKWKIKTWEKMKKELKKRFLPENYRQDNFLKLHNLRQIDLSVEEYTIEFELLLLKRDVVEPKEHTIARYLGSLNEEIGNVVLLQPYYSFNNVRKLAMIVKKQQKASSKSGVKAVLHGSSYKESSSSPKPTTSKSLS
ncbi:Retrotransposon gag domain [Dillenia turbinata]|uniref:Retrotransposon gag domain n=1 Tax=Dillenia turbinata TaxID=194707 RepID=A0AAN8YX01_9MAGN